jgi:methylated-DNA-[protein]-cysteine S-methyltransferase
MPRFTLFDTPVGACALVWGDRGLVGVLLPEPDALATRRRVERRYPGAIEVEPTDDVAHVIARIRGLLNGGRDDLEDIVLDMRAVAPFEQRVYRLARAIHPGSTRTYGQLARDLGDALVARAVGQALGANPFPIIVPCHRVLAAGAKAGGFSAPGGTRTKLRLLEIEGALLGGTPGLFD